MNTHLQVFLKDTDDAPWCGFEGDQMAVRYEALTIFAPSLAQLNRLRAVLDVAADQMLERDTESIDIAINRAGAKLPVDLLWARNEILTKVEAAARHGEDVEVVYREAVDECYERMEGPNPEVIVHETDPGVECVRGMAHEPPCVTRYQPMGVEA